jgi:hypothetical protein
MTCPFCKNDLIAGASVCGHCRAYASAARPWYAGLLLSIGLIVMLMSPITGLIFDIAQAKWIPLTILGGLFALSGSLISKETVWVMRA